MLPRTVGSGWREGGQAGGRVYTGMGNSVCVSEGIQSLPHLLVFSFYADALLIIDKKYILLSSNKPTVGGSIYKALH